ncbi:Ig-like domain-containing protein [Galbitalea soli]|uniref:Tandem-95 repeat protein n=1 Tax=Galbitalea soli TaxID=1268042 RepID=A0A7C9TPR2_9MICO|nr:tandem-95 repeat protein [Galbitalea soli]NEM90439.1 tandem-95 repeat protein [Galbitalea soli]NYJ31151.1 hypothetical protein [Galbitalea soli]
MIRQWFSSHRSLVATATSGSVIAAVIAAVAVVSTGYTAQQLDLNDSSVWVVNDSLQSVGRANTTIHSLNSVVSAAGGDLSVAQNGATVLLVDNSNSKLDIIDPATSTVRDSVPLPPGAPEVFLSGENVVIVAKSTGQVWVSPLSDVATFDAQSPAALSLGPGADVSVDDAGMLFAYAPATKQVLRVDPAVSTAVLSSDPVTISTDDPITITSVAGQWALLDARAGRVYTKGQSLDISGGPAGTGPVLQRASSTGSSVLIAGTAGLISVPFDGSSPTSRTVGQSGAPAAPLVRGGCAYAAWAGGQAWRRCAADTSAGVTLALASIPGDARLSFSANGARVVLSDARSGVTWAVQDSAQVIDNWAELIVPKQQQQQQNQQQEDTPPVVEKQQLPPVAVDDQLGARPGRTSPLPVLLNDYDPNGDVLAITSVSDISAKVGHLDVINQNQGLQITLAPTASGSVSFRYTISDGRGGTASAQVTVAIRTPSENSAPRQVRTTKSLVAAGGRVTTSVLGDWIDPDGDPFYLSNASTADPDSVTFQPGGQLSFSDGGTRQGVKTVALSVTDGSAVGTGSLAVTVRAAGRVPIIADPFIVVASAGQNITISPLAHVRGGTGQLRLNSVPAKAGVTIRPSYEAGTFEFTSTQLTTHYIDYVVTDGTQSVTGVVRVDVIAPPDPNTKPITIPKTMFVAALQTGRIDVADSDIDPAGGVLLVTGIEGLAADAGVNAEVLDQRVVRVSLTAPLKAPVRFGYRISNGLADAQGTITVIQIPNPAVLQPPVANDDSITVRVGAAIDIPVLANDVDPDGLPLTLVPTLPQNLPRGAGLLFASGRVLRYLAPQQPGNYTAVYEIQGPDGQSARAQVHIAVREVDLNTNNPPVPQTVVARALAGATVTIPIPLQGIDPDGDTVQLLGQETNPEKGSVTSVGSDSITYKAGDYSAGTDSFEYTVIDALGARATGTVRVGISPKLDGTRNPVARVDSVTVRPGVTVSVQVLANDSDPDGRPLHIVSVAPTDKVTRAVIKGNIVAIAPPTAPGDYAVLYTIANDTGGTSSNFVRVTVDPNAPLAFPVASDTVLTLSDILDRTSVTVDVLANVFFADGSSRDLGLSIYPGFGDVAQVLPTKRVEVKVTAHSQIIPFKVTHPKDPNVFSYAFIWVPGTDDALPQINRNAPALTVKSEARLIIDLNQYVIAVGGKQVRLTDTSTVRATHANGDDLVVGPSTLAFTSAPRYFGQASISFEVTDGQSATDPNGRKSVLVLPITVLPRDNQPPTFEGASLEFEPGQQVTIDLVKLTNYPYLNDLAELSYAVLAPLPVGFTTQLSGQKLTIRANDSAVKGTVSTATIAVRDKLSAGTAGRLTLAVVGSTRPLAAPAPDTAIARRGASTTVDVLANDAATNPFPGEPLRVIAIRGIDGASLPPGVTVTPSADNSRLTVAVSAAAQPVDTTLQYEVADATGDPARYVWGSVTISVQDRPDPVSAVRVTDFGDGRLTIAWNSGAFNNSPITGYAVIETNATTGAPISTTQCSGAQCQVATPGNGPANAVRLAVTATNAIGTSDPASLAGSAWSDVVPPPPADLASSPLDHGIRITWTKPAGSDAGSPITHYVVNVDGAASQDIPVSPGDAVGTAYSATVQDPGIANGSSVAYSVSARNAAPADLANWTRATGTGHPAGPPIKAASPNAAASTDDGTTATLSWDGAFTDNGRGISDYFAAVWPTGSTAPSCALVGSALPAASATVTANDATVKEVGTATQTGFSGLDSAQQYNFVVFAFNGMGCSASAVVTATPYARPGTVSDIRTSSRPQDSGDNTWDFVLRSLNIPNSNQTTPDQFLYQLNGDGVDGSTYGQLPIGSSAFLTTSDNSQYGVDVQVRVKACTTYPGAPTLCSRDWSAYFEVGVPVDNSHLGDLSFTQNPPDPGNPGAPITATWSWTSAPAGAGYDSVTYNCGDGDQPMTQIGSCDVTEIGTGGTDFPNISVTITSNGRSYTRNYDWQNPQN